MRRGYRIDLGSPVLPRLQRKTRNTVRRASKSINARQGTLNELKQLHWEPLYLPETLNKNQVVYTAILDDKPISAILLNIEGDHLVYRYAGNDRDHMSLNGNTYLLWWCAEHYNLKGYKYIDLGGSAKPNIEAYKRRLSTSSYPLKPKPLIQWLTAKINYRLRRSLVELRQP